MCISLQARDYIQQTDEFLKEEGLGAKERRLLLYKVNGGSRVIGDICKTLKTTPRTLFKTIRSLKEKGFLT